MILKRKKKCTNNYDRYYCTALKINNRDEIIKSSFFFNTKLQYIIIVY